MISKCIPRNSIQDPPSQRVKESKKNSNIENIEEPKREEKVVNKEKKIAKNRNGNQTNLPIPSVQRL